MKTLSSYTNHYSAFILLAVIAVGLVNINFFYNQTTFAFYGFCLSALIFTITTPYTYLTDNKVFIITKPLIGFVIWVLYILIQYGMGLATPYYTIYFVVLLLYFYKTTIVFNSSTFHFRTLFTGISILAVAESGYCLAQYFGFIATKNNYFAVTGSWTNPNVTALFLALTVPAFLFLFQSTLKKQAQIGFVLVLLALFLLKCRAAYIGSSLMILIYYGLKYQFLLWFKDQKNRLAIKALLVLSLLIVIPISSQLYHAKKASADGRTFIWKVATQMAIEKPIVGYGYGYFPREYNRFQSQYIQEGKTTADELQNVGIVNMPHNEILQQWVEGGVIGLALMVLFFAALLNTRKIQPKTTEKTVFTPQEADSDTLYHLSYAAVIAFIVMSMVNTTLIVTPVMGLLLLYAAILDSKQNPVQLGKIVLQFRQNKTRKLVFTILLLTICGYLFYLFVFMAIADRQNKIAFELKIQGNYPQALKILTQLEPRLVQDSDYWSNRASIYFQLKKYDATLACLKKASAITTEVDFHLGAAACYKKLKQYPEAIAQYQKLLLLKPSKYAYRFELLKLYTSQKDTINTLKTAQGILDLKPKIPSSKVNYYKKMAQKALFYFGKPRREREFINKTKQQY